MALDAPRKSRGGATSHKSSGSAGADLHKVRIEPLPSAIHRSAAFPSASLNPSVMQELIGVSFQALDLLNIGLIVCNASGRMLFANQTGEMILLSRDGLEVSNDGVLRTTKSSAQPLQEVIQQIASSVAGTNTARDVAISAARSSGRRALTLLIRSIATSSPRTADASQAAVLIIVTDADVPVAAREVELRRLYGLTSTESRLAKLLMEGKDLDDCCGEMGITRATVRMHRRNLFSKTGVRRQTQLITLLFKSIGLGPRPKE